MTTDHSITEMNAAIIALSLSDEAFSQMLTIAGADGPDVRIAYGRRHSEIDRLVVDEDGFAKLNFVGAAVLATVFKIFEASLAAEGRDG